MEDPVCTTAKVMYQTEFKKKMEVKRAALPPMPLEIYFNQDFQESSFISIANRPLPPLPKQIL